ncbi:16995_t:CDS:1, partial [Acaulospora colombiana]
LAKFPHHYIAVVLAKSSFKYALIEIVEVKDPEFQMGTGEYFITDFGWVQAERFLHLGDPEDYIDLPLENGLEARVEKVNLEDENAAQQSTDMGVLAGRKRKRPLDDVGLDLSLGEPTEEIHDPFDISTRNIRDLHAYCRARVAHIIIERQLKARNIPYVHVRAQPPFHSALNRSGYPSTIGPDLKTPKMAKSKLIPYLPILCVRTSDILAGAVAAEAAMPNIRIEPTEWWTLDDECLVNTSVRLKHVQPLDGAHVSNDDADGSVIQPSENISYDMRSGIVKFLSRKVDECVDEFLHEWARVSKAVVIARQGMLSFIIRDNAHKVRLVSLMPTLKGWKDVRILSFDLQTVQFAYYQDYAMSITSSDGSYLLSFSRCDIPTPEGGRTVTSSGMDVETPRPPSLPQSLPSTQSLSQPAPPPTQSQSQTLSNSQQPSGQINGRRNAHEDSIRFAQELLLDDRLSASVLELVAFLRATVGVVEALDAIEEAEVSYSSELLAEDVDVSMSPDKEKVSDGRVRGDRFSVVVKAAGWWRILYPPATLFNRDAKTYALDLRMVNGRFMIVDASVDLRHGKRSTSNSSGVAFLAPIPDLEARIRQAIESLSKENADPLKTGPSSDSVPPVSRKNAIICGPADAPPLIT